MGDQCRSGESLDERQRVSCRQLQTFQAIMRKFKEHICNDSRVQVLIFIRTHLRQVEKEKKAAKKENGEKAWTTFFFNQG